MKTLHILLILILLSCHKEKTILIQMNTEIGKIKLELYPEKAPITVNNFLKYVNENRYDDFHFYRVVHIDNQPYNNIKIEVIQGGLGFEKHPSELPPIPHEITELTGIKHLDGTISMARSEPGTASSEIFICINDQPDLDFQGKRNPDGQGFAAFGKVKSGMDIVRKIQSLPEMKQILNNKVKVNDFKQK